MNRLLVIASILAALTTMIHLFVGGSDTAVPLLESPMEGEPRLTLYAVWHMVSVVLGLSAVALLVGSLPRHAQGARYLVLFISVMWCIFAVVFLGVAAMQEEGGWLFRLPQWILLLPVGVLGLWAFVSTASNPTVESEEHS